MIKGDTTVFHIRYPTTAVKQLLQGLFQLEHTVTERSDRRGKRWYEGHFNQTIIFPYN